MGGEGEQWLLVRNERGEELLGLLGDEVVTRAPGSAGKRQGPVKGFLANVERAAGGLPLRRMPQWLRPIVGWLMPRIGPKRAGIRPGARGDEGSRNHRASAARKAAEMKSMVPAHVWKLVEAYGITPVASELPAASPRERDDDSARA
jgi:coenzyme F420 hydrogenase subunit beta